MVSERDDIKLCDRNNGGEQVLLLVSVVIPTYNRDFCICDAVDTVLAQTYKNYEIIVVDDGSTDQTKEMLQKYGDKIIYIWQENAGVSIARNAGIHRAKGEWVAFLDSDDEWLPEKLEKQVAYILDHPEIVAHTTNCTIIHKNENFSLFAIRGVPDFGQGGTTIYEPLQDVMFMQFMTPCIMVKKDILIDAGLFDAQLSFAEDIDCFSQIALLGAWGVSCEQLVKVYRKGSDDVPNLSSQHSVDPSISPRTMLQVYEKIFLQEYLLSEQDLKFVRRGIGLNLFKLAIIARQNKEYVEGWRLLMRSAFADFTPKTVIKAIFVGVFGQSLYNVLRSVARGNNSGFRRTS